MPCVLSICNMILLAGFAYLSGRTGLSSDSDQGGPCQLFTSIAMNDSITWRSGLEKNHYKVGPRRF